MRRINLGIILILVTSLLNVASIDPARPLIPYQDPPPDTDLDGIPDDQDLCPQVAGLPQFQGCPDIDADGIQDNQDSCPQLAGLPQFQGCPDTDADGIQDNQDSCPQIAGLPQFQGCPDTDADGIQDSQDTCPQLAGLPQFQGCPDTDADGIQDSQDLCPQLAGLPQFQGCPDTDADGIQDSQDICLQLAGLPQFQGCPDTDADGIQDNQDSCPQLAGLPQFQGCPDTDADGVDDLNDQCPDVLGVTENNGCPADDDLDTIPNVQDACPAEYGLPENEGCPIKVLTPVDFSFSAPVTRVSQGETLTVEIIANGLAQGHGLASICQIDPTIFARSNVSAGSLFDPLNHFLSDSTVDATGNWVVGITQQAPAPALEGGGQMLIMTFQANGSGLANLTCSFKASNREGSDLPITTPSVTISLESLAPPDTGNDSISGSDTTTQGENTLTGDESTSGSDTTSGNSSESGNDTTEANDSTSGNDTENGNGSDVGEDSSEGNNTLNGNDSINSNGSDTGEDSTSGSDTVNGEDSTEGENTLETVEEPLVIITSEVGAFARSLPNVASTDLAIVEFNQVFTPLGYAQTDQIWFAILLPDGQRGWVSSAVAALNSGDLSQLTLITDYESPAIEATEETQSISAPTVRIISEINAVAHTSPSADSSEIIAVEFNQLYSVLGYTETDQIWYLIGLDGQQEGWVSAEIAALAEGFALTDLIFLPISTEPADTHLLGQVLLTPFIKNLQVSLSNSIQQETISPSPDGQFEIDNLPPAEYILKVQADYHISYQQVVYLTEGEIITLNPITLIHGDVTADDAINGEDFALVSIHYGLNVPPAAPDFDLNQNQKIDIFDLTIVSSNYGISADVLPSAD